MIATVSIIPIHTYGERDRQTDRLVAKSNTHVAVSSWLCILKISDRN